MTVFTMTIVIASANIVVDPLKEPQCYSKQIMNRLILEWTELKYNV